MIRRQSAVPDFEWSQFSPYRQINMIAYQPTGPIMKVTPRVNSGGLVDGGA